MKPLSLSTEPARRIANVTAVVQAVVTLVTAVAVVVGWNVSVYDDQITAIGASVVTLVNVFLAVRSGDVTREYVSPTSSPVDDSDVDPDGEL